MKLFSIIGPRVCLCLFGCFSYGCSVESPLSKGPDADLSTSEKHHVVGRISGPFLVEGIAAILKHGDLDDAEFTGKALGTEFRALDESIPGYDAARTPMGLDPYVFYTLGISPHRTTTLHFFVDPAYACVTVEQLKKEFGPIHLTGSWGPLGYADLIFLSPATLPTWELQFWFPGNNEPVSPSACMTSVYISERHR